MSTPSALRALYYNSNTQTSQYLSGLRDSLADTSFSYLLNTPLNSSAPLDPNFKPPEPSYPEDDEVSIASEESYSQGYNPSQPHWVNQQFGNSLKFQAQPETIIDDNPTDPIEGPEQLTIGELDDPDADTFHGVTVKPSQSSAAKAIADIMPKGEGKAAGGLLDGKGGPMLAAAHIASGAMQAATGLGSTAMKDNTEMYMQQQSIAQQQWETNTNNQFQLQYQQNSFNNNSALMAQSFSQQSKLMSQSLAEQESYYTFVMGNETQALQQAGLPSYLAYMPGGTKSQPPMTQFTPSGTTYTARISGNPTMQSYTGTSQQVAAGYGNVSTPAPNTMPT